MFWITVSFNVINWVFLTSIQSLTYLYKIIPVYFIDIIKYSRLVHSMYWLFCITSQYFFSGDIKVPRAETLD